MSHKAIVAKIDRVGDIDGANTIQIAYVLGERVIVNKSSQVGDEGVFFMPDLQLSEDFCAENNLFRDKTLNKDKERSGFFEANRRVRAQPFMKVKSEGFFVPFDYFDYTGYSAFKIGDQFDELNGHKICCKYVSEKTRKAIGNNNTKSMKKSLVPDFKEHVDTEQFKYNIDKIPVGALISIQAKRHGTSGRYAYTKVFNELPKWKQLVNKVVPIFPEYNWDYVVGTRRVVLKNHERVKDGFHGSEEFRFEILDALKPHLTKGMEIFGEIVGYANGKPIMPAHSTKELKDKAFTKKYGDSFVYKYGCLEGTYKFIVYRVVITNEDGTSIDMTQPQLVDWCNKRGLEPCLDVCSPFVYNGDKESLTKLVEELTERTELLTEDYTDPSHINEGVIIRVDHTGMTPLFLKNKSYAFKVCEGIAKEVDVDTEDAS